MRWITKPGCAFVGEFLAQPQQWDVSDQQRCFMYYKYHFFAKGREETFLSYFLSLCSSTSSLELFLIKVEENRRQIQHKHNTLKSLGTLVSLNHHCFITSASFLLAGKDMPCESREKDTL